LQIIPECSVINDTSAKMLMRRIPRPILTLLFSLFLALLSAGLTYSSPPALQGNPVAGVIFLQPTKTPQPKDLSVIGSTDGIVIMGFVIALIIIVPILLRRKSWMEPR
jgi:hypothetical protein